MSRSTSAGVLSDRGKQVEQHRATVFLLRIRKSELFRAGGENETGRQKGVIILISSRKPFTPVGFGVNNCKQASSLVLRNVFYVKRNPKFLKTQAECSLILSLTLDVPSTFRPAVHWRAFTLRHLQESAMGAQHRDVAKIKFREIKLYHKFKFKALQKPINFVS